MALRVLLADESSTIKKVFQLALQDFAVEVRPVNVGVDVVPVAQNFKPDIIFADVLLQKKNGYEVSSEIKQDPQLGRIPIVLMWSGFMELDEDKFQASMANAQLEKPFDVTALRKLVTELVPRTQGQRISEFLTFPPMPEMQEQHPAPAPQEASGEEDFKQVSIPKMKGDKFRVNLKPEEMDSEHLPVEYEVPSEKISMDEVFKTAENEDEPFAIRETARREEKNQKPVKSSTPPPTVKMQSTPMPMPAAPKEAAVDLELEDLVEVADDEPAQAPTVRSAGATVSSQLSEEQLEKIIREQSREVIESVVWKVVPDLAAQIIERELTRLLKEREAHP